MTSPGSIAATVHDAIDQVATAVEDIHQSVAAFPLEILSEITPFEASLNDVKAAQRRTIEAIYDLVHRINHRARALTVQAAGRS